MENVTLYSGSIRQDRVRELIEAYKELKQVVNIAQQAPAEDERLPSADVCNNNYQKRHTNYIKRNVHTSSGATLEDLMKALNTSQSSGSDHCYKCCLDQLDYKTFKKQLFNSEDLNADFITLQDIENAIQTTCSRINLLRAEIQKQQEPVYRPSALNSSTEIVSKSSPDKFELMSLCKKSEKIKRLRAELLPLMGKLAQQKKDKLALQLDRLSHHIVYNETLWIPGEEADRQVLAMKKEELEALAKEDDHSSCFDDVFLRIHYKTMGIG